MLIPTFETFVLKVAAGTLLPPVKFPAEPRRKGLPIIFCCAIRMKRRGPFWSCGAPATTVPNEFGPKRKVFFVLKSENFRHNNASERS